MARRISRKRITSRFKVGQLVRIENEYSGDYRGVVVETHSLLSLPSDAGTITGPGVTVEVRAWGGDGYYDPETYKPGFKVEAHDDAVRLEDVIGHVLNIGRHALGGA